MCATVVPASYVHSVPTPKLNQGGSEPLGRGVLDTALRLKEKVVNFR